MHTWMHACMRRRAREPSSSSPPSSSTHSPFQHILITSRLGPAHWNNVHGINKCIALDKLSLDESELMLYRIAMSSTSGWDDSEAQDRFNAFMTNPTTDPNVLNERQSLAWICGRDCLDGFPLALQQVGSFLDIKIKFTILFLIRGAKMGTYFKNGHIHGRFNKLRNDSFDEIGKIAATKFLNQKNQIARVEIFDLLSFK